MFDTSSHSQVLRIRPGQFCFLRQPAELESSGIILLAFHLKMLMYCELSDLQWIPLVFECVDSLRYRYVPCSIRFDTPTLCFCGGHRSWSIRDTGRFVAHLCICLVTCRVQVIFLRFLVTGVLMLMLTRVPDTQLIKVGYRLLAALCLAITSQVHRQSTLCSAAGAVFLIYKHACVTVIEWSARRFTSTEYILLLCLSSAVGRLGITTEAEA